MRVYTVCTIAAIVMFTGCTKPEDLAKKAMWDGITEKLKAPSTAKMVAFEATQINDVGAIKAAFLESDFSYKNSNQMLNNYANNNTINPFEISGLGMEYSKVVEEFKVKISSHDIKIKEWLESKPSLYDIGTYKSKKQNHNVLKEIQIVHKTVLEGCEKNFNRKIKNIKFYICSIEYDAQNSFGVPLRDKAYARVILNARYDGSADVIGLVL